MKSDANEVVLYENHYACTSCGNHWTDVWSAMCDDDCASCGTTMTPYCSEEL